MKDETTVQYLTVEASSEGIAETDHGRRVVSVPRSEIVRIELRYGVASERPILIGLIGLVVLVASLWPIKVLYDVLTKGGTFYTGMIWISAFFVLGAWLIGSAVRRRLHLLVHTRRGQRKLIFQGDVEWASVVDFIEAAEKLGFPITLCVSQRDLPRFGARSVGDA